MPIYNEEQMLKRNALMLLNYCEQASLPYDWQVVMVINGSSDESLNIAKSLKEEHQERFCVVNYEEPGRGRALKRYWLESNADILAYMDLDLAVSLSDIPELVNPIINNEYDLVVGSRLMAGSKIERSFVRELTSQSCHLISRLMLGHKFTDLQCGFKAISKKAFEKIAPQIIDPGWFFDTELAVFAQRADLRIKELPVDWSEERYDKRKSKVRIFRDTRRFMKNFIKFRRRLAKME